MLLLSPSLSLCATIEYKRYVLFSIKCCRQTSQLTLRSCLSLPFPHLRTWTAPQDGCEILGVQGSLGGSTRLMRPKKEWPSEAHVFEHLLRPQWCCLKGTFRRQSLVGESGPLEVSLEFSGSRFVSSLLSNFWLHKQSDQPPHIPATCLSFLTCHHKGLTTG